MKMENTIKNLLFRYDCVIIPDFGGFVAKRKPAIFHPIDYKFEPPRKVVGFNIDLTHNDGLLANEISKEKNISYQEAMEFIQNEVQAWKIALENNQTIFIDSLGSLKINKDIIEFKPVDNQNFAIESYGLPAIKGQYILRNKEVQTATRKPISWVSYTAALGFALLVGASGYLANQNIVQNQLSSVLPLLDSKTLVEEKTETPIAPLIEVHSIEIDGKSYEVSIQPLVEETVETNENLIEESEEEIDLSVKKYQVIGGSFKVYSRAMEHQALLHRQGYDRAIIIGKVGSFFMVAYDTFHDESEALALKRELERKGKDVFMRP